MRAWGAEELDFSLLADGLEALADSLLPLPQSAARIACDSTAVIRANGFYELDPRRCAL